MRTAVVAAALVSAALSAAPATATQYASYDEDEGAAKGEAIQCPDSDFCIDVGRKFEIKVTSDRLRLDCRNPDGTPDNERITPNVTGQPKTGDATAVFNPEVFRAHTGHSLLTIRTTLTTASGIYRINIGGTGEHCGRYPGFRFTLEVRPIIRGPDTIWSFGGPKPAGYPTEITLTALPEGRPPYIWEISDARYLVFPGNRRIIQTRDNKAKVIGRLATKLLDPPSVQVRAGSGGASLFHEILVRAPDRLERLFRRDISDPDKGYVSVTRYRILDQYGRGLRGPDVPINIVFFPQREIYPNTNWVRPPRPHFLADPSNLGLVIFPVTPGGRPVQVGVPKAENPHAGSTEVDCWKAAIYVGSEDPGGVKVDTLTYLRYRDHAISTNLNCPP